MFQNSKTKNHHINRLYSNYHKEVGLCTRTKERALLRELKCFRKMKERNIDDDINDI